MGTTDENIDLYQIPGDLRLKYKTTIHTDTTDGDFNSGYVNNSPLVTRVSRNGEGKVTLGKSYLYSSGSFAGLSSRNTGSSFLDVSKGLLYINTSLGVSVIDTRNTVDPTDDSLIITYSTESTPALPGNMIHNSFLKNDLLYISIDGQGLSVINTQGTVSPSDDVLVTTYTTTTTPAIDDSTVKYAFLDDLRNLLYIATLGGGLTVINTQGTVSAGDDTLVKTYKTTTTPAIGHNSVSHAFLDETTHLLYVSTSGGLTVINTQGTVTATDDVLVITYKTTTTPAIGGNNVSYSFMDSVHNLLYVGTLGGGLTVINTQGTVTATDDVLVITYKTTTTPAIANNYVVHAFLDSANDLLYVSSKNDPNINNGALSVIDTRGTVSPADDVLVKTYNNVSTPEIVNNSVHNSFLDGTHHLLYVSVKKSESGAFYEEDNKSGLSVVDIDNVYNSEGVYVKTVYAESSDTWQNKAPLPEETKGAGSAVIGSKIYVVGGGKMSCGNCGHNTLLVYDTATDTWETKSPMVQTRTRPMVVAYDSKLYVFGGATGVYPTKTELSSVEIYDPETDTWTAGAPMSRVREGAVGGVYNGKIYVVGGGPVYISGGLDCSGLSSTEMEIYDPETDTWEAGTPAPVVKMNQASGQFINGKLYIVGARRDCDGMVSNSMASYDPATDTWDTDLAFLPSYRGGGDTVVINGKLIYIGGKDDALIRAKDIYSYDPEYDKWDIIGILPTGLNRVSTELVNGGIYAIGGSNTDLCTDVDNDSDTNVLDTNYFFSLEYISDTYQKEVYSELSWEATIPEGTSIEMFYSFDEGQTYTSLGTDPGIYALPVNLSRNFRYKAVLATQDNSITPSLDSVEIKYARQEDGLFISDSGTYTSQTLSFPNTNELLSFQTDQTIPEGTSIEYQYSIDNGSTWADFTPPITFPQYTKANNFTWKATLSTQDPNITPVIHSATLQTSESNLEQFQNDNKSNLSANEESISFKDVNYRSDTTPRLKGKNPKARNGTITLYTKTDKGGTKKLKTISINEKGSWNFNLSSKEGKNQYAVRYIDSTGNRSDISDFFTLITDKTDPFFINPLPEKKTLTRKERIDFLAADNPNGSGLSYYKVQLVDMNGKVLKSWRRQGVEESFYLLPESLPLGTYLLNIRAYDKAGNRVDTSIVLNYVSQIQQVSSQTETQTQAEEGSVQGARTERQVTEEIQNPTNSTQETQQTQQSVTPPALTRPTKNFVLWNPWTW